VAKPIGCTGSLAASLTPPARQPHRRARQVPARTPRRWRPTSDDMSSPASLASQQLGSSRAVRAASVSQSASRACSLSGVCHIVTISGNRVQIERFRLDSWCCDCVAKTTEVRGQAVASVHVAGIVNDIKADGVTVANLAGGCQIPVVIRPG